MPERTPGRCWHGTAGLLAAVLAVSFVNPVQRARFRSCDVSQYIHDQWESDRGFPAVLCMDITQTSDGYLWIAAEKGLVRFDGLTLPSFSNRQALTSETRSPRCWGLAADTDSVSVGSAGERHARGVIATARFEDLPSSLSAQGGQLACLTSHAPDSQPGVRWLPTVTAMVSVEVDGAHDLRHS